MPALGTALLGKISRTSLALAVPLYRLKVVAVGIQQRGIFVWNQVSSHTLQADCTRQHSVNLKQLVQRASV